MRQEADTLLELDESDLSEFLSLVPEWTYVGLNHSSSTDNLTFREIVDDVIRSLLDSQPKATWDGIWERRIQGFTVPWVYSQLMAAVDDAVPGRLRASHKRETHAAFKQALEDLVAKQ